MRGLGGACGSPATAPGGRPGTGRRARRLCLHRATGSLLCPAPGHGSRNPSRKRKAPGAFVSQGSTPKHESQHLTSPGPAAVPGYQPPGCPGQRRRRSRAPRVPNNPLGTSESRRLRRRPASREAALFPGSGGWRSCPAHVLGERAPAAAPARPRLRAARLGHAQRSGNGDGRPLVSGVRGSDGGGPPNSPARPRGEGPGSCAERRAGLSPNRLLVAG